MNRPARTRAAAALIVLVAALVPLAMAGGASAVTVTGSLTVTPKHYVPGEAVRFRGQLGSAANSIHLQSHMNRAGDTWMDVPNSSFETDSTGDFDFKFRAPAMINLKYRVVGGGLATPSYLFHASPQELTLTPTTGPNTSPGFPFYKVDAGAPFTVMVDTTPPVGGAFGSPPPIPGRTVTLQQRTSPSGWKDLGTTTTDSQGNASFSVTAPASGTEVLRARQEAWTKGGSQIGWYASFPASFTTGDVPSTRPRTTSVSPTSGTSSRDTASQRYRWGPTRFDYAWEAGQALDAPPSKGNVLGGQWRQTSDGTGRVTPYNGGMVLQSKYQHVGPGDRGTTTVTLHGAAQKYGRWEFRLQGRPWETGARPYEFRLELVPAGSSVPAKGACAPQSIVLAQATLGKPGLEFGVRSQSAGSVWSRTLAHDQVADQPFNMAVEVTPGHITWFRNSKPVGTVTDPSAQLGVKLTPRMSLIGKQNVEMDGAQVNSDWQRSWTLDSGRKVTSGAALTPSPYAGC